MWHWDDHEIARAGIVYKMIRYYGRNDPTVMPVFLSEGGFHGIMQKCWGTEQDVYFRIKQDLYYVEADGRMKSVMESSFDGDASDISDLMKEDIFTDRTLDRVEKDSPVFYRTLKEKGLESALIMRFGSSASAPCYLVCAVERAFRIWQDNECAILYYLTGLLEQE